MNTIEQYHRAANQLCDLSEWIDNSYDDCSKETVMWRRIAKIAEESGEAIQALLGAIGENPRKGVTHTTNDVIEELLDVSIAALGAVEHLTGNNAESIDLLLEKINKVDARRLSAVQRG